MASIGKLFFSLIFFIILEPMVGEEDIQGNREGHRRLFLDLYNLDIPGGSEWIRIWLMLGFPFFFLLSFSFSFRSLPPLVEFATKPRLFSFSLYCHYPLSPSAGQETWRFFFSVIFY